MEERLKAIRERIAFAAGRSGRKATDVTLVAVTKTHSPESIVPAIRLGLRSFGENRVQEAARKYPELVREHGALDLRLIGHLQTNKAKIVPGLFQWVESVDSVKVARALSARLHDSGGRCEVLLQLNSSGEESKSGFLTRDELLAAANDIAELSGMTIRGVMTIGPFASDASRIRRAFEVTRECFTALGRALGAESVDTLSMGMSDDFEIAIEEGSTEVRLGSALFGPRGSYA